jgi:hypothetical protein
MSEDDSMLGAAGDFLDSAADAAADTAYGVEHSFESFGNMMEMAGDRFGAATGEFLGRPDVRDHWENEEREDRADMEFQDLQARRAFSDAGEHVWGPADPEPHYDELLRPDPSAEPGMEPEPHYDESLQPDPYAEPEPAFDPGVPATGGV